MRGVGPGVIQKNRSSAIPMVSSQSGAQALWWLGSPTVGVPLHVSRRALPQRSDTGTPKFGHIRHGDAGGGGRSETTGRCAGDVHETPSSRTRHESSNR